jgi:eukaryotic-like serine/threonine-protein kinase
MESVVRPAPEPESLRARGTGRYVPFGVLGSGGMAEVLLAVAQGPMGFNKLAVVKQLRQSDDAEHVSMFLDEARLSARLSHPNIVNIYDVGDEDGQLYLAMEYLEGQSLAELNAALTRRGIEMPPTLAAYVAAHVLKGLHYAHELCDYDGTPLGIVHRDVSPQNVVVTYDGEIKLLDFGIAKATVNDARTQTGILKGKPRYMAPEQATGADVDRRADVFALGIILWEMVTHQRLFAGDALATLARIASEDAPLAGSVRPGVNPLLEAAIAGALTRDPERRTQTADAMRLELEAYLNAEGFRDGDRVLADLLRETFADSRKRMQERVRKHLALLPKHTGEAAGPGAAGLPRVKALPSLGRNDTSGATTAVLTPPPHRSSATAADPTHADSSTSGLVLETRAGRRSLLAVTLVACAVVTGSILFVARVQPEVALHPQTTASASRPMAEPRAAEPAALEAPAAPPARAPAPTGSAAEPAAEGPAAEGPAAEEPAATRPRMPRHVAPTPAPRPSRPPAPSATATARPKIQIIRIDDEGDEK